MRCLINGLNFLLKQVSYEVFKYIEGQPLQFEDVKSPDKMFPYMLVNIGSGVSILKVTGENQFERISGTSLGGGTLWGLLRLTTDCKDFDEMVGVPISLSIFFFLFFRFILLQQFPAFPPFSLSSLFSSLFFFFLFFSSSCQPLEITRTWTCLWATSTARTTAAWA